jgi:hypothetical protein
MGIVSAFRTLEPDISPSGEMGMYYEKQGLYQSVLSGKSRQDDFRVADEALS